MAKYPVQDVHFALYLQHLGNTMKSKAAVEEAINAISWVHGLFGLPPVAKSPFVEAFLSRFAKDASQAQEEEGTYHPQYA